MIYGHSKVAPFGHHPSKHNGFLISRPYPRCSASSIHLHPPEVAEWEGEAGQLALVGTGLIPNSYGGVMEFIQTRQLSESIWLIMLNVGA